VRGRVGVWVGQDGANKRAALAPNREQ